MSLAWLTPPVTLTGGRMFVCDPLTPEQCAWYMQRWHYWYIADYVFALPTVAFFMSVIGVFIIGHFASSLLFRHRKLQRVSIWQKSIAGIRWLSYRGFHVKQLRWNSAPVGVLLLGAVGTIFFFCMDLVPKPYYWPSEIYGNSPALATRSGWLATACMPFVFATASKTNWITLLTGVSHERLQVFHRWIAYAFFILALLHTFPFIVYHIRWHDMEAHFASNLLFYWTGIVALVFQAWLTFMSHSTIRSLGYEFFKITHFVSVAIFMLTFFWHCDYTLTSWHYFIATAAVYVPCFVYPWLRAIFEYRWTQQAHIVVEDNGFTRITVPVKFHWTPGQHCFLRFTSFGFLQSISTHPFTICSSPANSTNEQNELVFYLRHQGGFTAKLYQHALDHADKPVRVQIDGPYGGVNSSRLHDADHLVVIAGGAGAGWCLPFVERFVRSAATSGDEEQGYNAPTDEKTVSAGERRVSAEKTAVRGRHHNPTSLRVILATRDTSSRIWFERTVSELLARYPASSVSSSIRVQVYLTGEAAEKADLPHKSLDRTSSQGATSSNDERIVDPEKGVETAVPGKEFEGRPKLPLIIQDEAAKVAEAGESLGVYVCGPTTMLNDVRNAVASANLNILKGSRSGSVYLHSEHFEWA
ncbi:hypothetical protein BT63DRAFT_135537 [Microthyrium microscopicum]|uniref:ferric-chelate reductase (NADPH) n=1 Tax=Microthyrium microscopicum TaxID=703497 RepID=A0A6A6UKE4_9PEZI|nr:hypothetical protein BT63DRAFT_135537 [Microthyrium microscopicum]